MFFYNLKRFIAHPKRRKKVVLTAVILTVIVLLSMFDTVLSHTVSSLAETAIRGKGAEYINNGAAKIFSDVEFDDIYTLTRENNGNITGVFLDSFTVNKLKTDIVSEVNRLFKEGEITVDIPIGNAVDSLFFGGRGKTVNIKILSVAVVESKLISKTEDSGVNQTHLSSYMNIKADIKARVGKKNIEVSTESDVLLCESLIVGDIPDSFTNVNVIDEETLRWLNSYN